ncbi:LysR family transcriptional regulator [Ktedonosporobacter rubrisoli]|uniref:LysR family transcriptional regulator n=1 Tax=Ktedonosporobacter rubrisoli TaxID=2509675 RepID=A0A4P6JNB2_KTERU|nr:LysR family transcriptional regulator [Ktedonosporobacter rubrisoli]QBD76216.1 LysR family transcriptional regulator [Ktedonosporobacter rubrisoli]
MELRQLIMFQTLAQTLNFTRTAKTLNYVQSNVTAQIQSLETELGVRLFDRLGKRVVLTDAGQRLLPYVEQVLASVDALRASLSTQDSPVGTLTVSAPETLCTYRLPRLLHQVAINHPRVRVHFRPIPVADLRKAVSEGLLDVAFVLEEPIHSSQLNVNTLLTEPIQLVVAPGYPLATHKQVEPLDMETETLLLTESGCGYRALFEHELAGAGVRASSIVEFNSIEAIKQCVMLGMGVALLPQMAIQAEVAAGKMVMLPWTRPLEVQTQMIWHREKWLSPALQTLLEMVKQMQW